MKAKSKNTMKENVVVTDVEVLEEVAEVEQEEVVVEDVVDVAKEEVLEAKLKSLEQKQHLREETIQDLDKKEDHIVEQMVSKMMIVKVVTKLKEEEVEITILMIKEVKNTITMKEHQVDTKNKMKEVLKVDPEVAKEITSIKIDKKEVELKAVTQMRVELEEETEVLANKMLMTNQHLVEQEEEPKEEALVEEKEK